MALSAEERATAAALVAPYRSEGAFAGRPATRAEIAEALHVSERTAQRRLDALAAKLDVAGDAGRERPRLIAARVIELGLDRPRGELVGPTGSSDPLARPGQTWLDGGGGVVGACGCGAAASVGQRSPTERNCHAPPITRSPHSSHCSSSPSPARASRGAIAGAVVFSKSTTVERRRQRRPLRRQGRPSQPAHRRPDRHRTGLLPGRHLDRLRPRRPPLLGPRRRLRAAAADQRLQARLDAGGLAGRHAASSSSAAPRPGPRPTSTRSGPTAAACTPLTSGAADDHDADFSPDGKAIVFVRDTSAPNATRTSSRSARAVPGWPG